MPYVQTGLRILLEKNNLLSSDNSLSAHHPIFFIFHHKVDTLNSQPSGKIYTRYFTSFAKTAINLRNSQDKIAVPLV